MRLFVNCVVSSIRKLELDTKNLGSLVSPRRWDTMESLTEFGIPFGADNDAFCGFDFDRYVDMLQMLRSWPIKPEWVTLPDVVGDSWETEKFSGYWAEPVRRLFGLKVAYVIQDGQTVENMPWELADAIFIGGSTEYKLGASARKIVTEAKDRDMLVHMGRVNTRKRLTYAHQIGCDSVDGSSFNMFRDTHIPWAVEYLEDLGDVSVPQLELFG